MSRYCHDDYAFVVRQRIAGLTVTIYNGPAAGQWFDAGDDDIDLTSYHPKAVGCREDAFPTPVTGAFVVLQDIGLTESHRLRTPLADGPDSVATPDANAGLLDLGVDYALGGSPQLRYHFSEVAGASMQTLGARYYRVQWAPANAADGKPAAAGSWETLFPLAWKTWRVVGSDIVPGSHSLGPVTVGAHSGLFHIPFETGGLLGAGEEWQDGQFHAVVPTVPEVEGRYLIRLEVFDGAGTRLERAGGSFSFRRWNTPTTTVPVLFGALTHMIRTDNRPVVAEIADVTGPGDAIGDCKFFVGKPTDTVDVEYRAYHPEPVPPSFMLTPSFMLDYYRTVRRGISGSYVLDLVDTAEVGEWVSPFARSLTVAALLAGESRCSFAVNLWVRARVHDGIVRLDGLGRRDVAAFAVEL